MSIAYLLSGSNQGDRIKNLQSAITYINKLAGEIIKCSSIFESPAWGFDHPSPFLNQAIKLKTVLEPEALLQTLLSIEASCGRLRNDSDKYEARTLDIDILFYDDMVIDSEGLKIPHPRGHLRRFALLPLSEIAAGLIHPLMKKNIQELLDVCQDESIVTVEVRDAV